MKVLFDQGVPVPLRARLAPHVVSTAYERGWSVLKNGELIAAAEAAGFDQMLTTDQNLKYQQNLSGRRLAIIVLLSTSWPRIQKVSADILTAAERLASGGYIEIVIP